jgi:hypothetical protein
MISLAESALKNNEKHTMKAYQRWIPLLAMTLLCGCFQVQDELSLQPDGSGRVKMTLQSDLPEEMLGMLGMGARYGSDSAPVYPPTSEHEARRFFPSKDFALKVEQKTGDKGKTLVVEAGFKDVNALLASPYGRAHQLTLRTNDNGTLTFQALSGGNILAQAAQFKPGAEMTGFEMPGMEDAQKKKVEMRFQFRVTLPNTATGANGTREDKTVTWSVERAQCKDDDEFAAKLSGVLEAGCSASGLKFSPLTPARLGLLPFSRLVAGKTAVTSALPDTNKIAGAARFVPGVLHVRRSLDLSGEDHGAGSEAQLTGAVVLPQEFTPQQWGQVKLEDATDAAGNSLMPKEDSDSMMSRVTHFGGFGMGEVENEENEEEEGTSPPRDPEPKPHIVTLSFKAPEWKVKRIARIKATLELQYFGASEIIKLSNAVPAALVMDMTKRSSPDINFDSERGQVTDPRLAELGLSMRVQMAMAQQGMTTLSLATTGRKTALINAQLFDGDGKPWPTTLTLDDSGGRDERSAQLIVAGNPKPPFSLALELGGVGAAVGVPILVENVPVEDK